MILGNKSKGLYKSCFKVREMGEVQITFNTNTKEKKNTSKMYQSKYGRKKNTVQYLNNDR